MYHGAANIGKGLSTFHEDSYVRGVVPGYVQCTRLSYSKINYDSVIIEGIDTYVFDKTTLR